MVKEDLFLIQDILQEEVEEDQYLYLVMVAMVEVQTIMDLIVEQGLLILVVAVVVCIVQEKLVELEVLVW
jgi:hypothetical protein